MSKHEYRERELIVGEEFWEYWRNQSPKAFKAYLDSLPDEEQVWDLIHQFPQQGKVFWRKFKYHHKVHRSKPCLEYQLIPENYWGHNIKCVGFIQAEEENE